MFVLTLNKNGVKRLGALAVCAALLAGTVYGVSRYSQVQSAAALPAGAPTTIETTQDIAAFFSGYGLEVDLANTTVDKVKVPKKWDDSFSAFNEVVKASGLDLAGMAGCYLGVAAAGKTAVVDGFISSVAALLAVRVCPACKDYMIASHRSGEPGSAIALSELGLYAPLDAGMRLGEGSGAVMFFPLIEEALHIYQKLPSFDEGHVETYEEFD